MQLDARRGQPRRNGCRDRQWLTSVDDHFRGQNNDARKYEAYLVLRRVECSGDCSAEQERVNDRPRLNLGNRSGVLAENGVRSVSD